MLTRAGYALLGAAFSLLVAGLAAGNFYYATAALVPLGVLLVGLAIEAPSGVSLTLMISKAAPRAGETTTVEVRYRVEHGAGPVEFHVALPEVAALKSGSNLHVVTKDATGPLEGVFAFDVEWPKRGIHTLGPVTAEIVHGAMVRKSVEAKVAEGLEIEVRPALAPVRRIRGLSGFAKQLFPENDQAATGIRTTEFREIRAYQAGDPVKSINWKATGRLPGFADGTESPLVNEYEREGKKNVWLFLDAASYMQFGTTVKNSFELALAAAAGVAEFYLARGYKVGFSVYNHGDPRFLHADSGQRQRLEIQRVLTRLAPATSPGQGLQAAVDRVHRQLLADKPLVVIVTRLGKADERTFAALAKLRALTGRRRRRIPVLLISPVVHGALPREREYDRDVVDLLRRHDRPAVARARRLGARVVEWDPSRARLEALLTRGGWAN